ncbi:MAG: molybdopterin-dependent oxidoreductase [Chloroflexia bacterium]|nr:molybdopterin-dependent oxidoreductase [Chloroflexia bacterium]
MPRSPVVPASVSHRVPPGQIIATRWPVLHQGEIPPFDPDAWRFHVWGLVAQPSVWTWEEFQFLPVRSTVGDLHCVTRWSNLDHEWRGVSPGAIAVIAGVLPAARIVVFHADGGYTANIPIEAFHGSDVVLATHHAGQPLTPEHGAPLRAVVPGRYAWKSVKWLRGIEFLAADRPGFWEEFGYSNSADAWREERFES